jgi:two-component system response regulator MtrA
VVIPVVNLRLVSSDHDVVVVVAVTREVSARVHLVRQLSGESVLLLVPDQATAARTLGDGNLPTGPDQPDDPRPALHCGGLAVDPLRQQVTWHGATLRLTRLERNVLGCLIEPPIRVWSYEHLYRAVWRETWLGDTSTLHATVKRLRRKLRDAGVTVFLESLRGVGFQLMTKPTEAIAAPAPVGSVVDGSPSDHQRTNPYTAPLLDPATDRYPAA